MQDPHQVARARCQGDGCLLPQVLVRCCYLHIMNQFSMSSNNWFAIISGLLPYPVATSVHASLMPYLAENPYMLWLFGALRAALIMPFWNV